MQLKGKAETVLLEKKWPSKLYLSNATFSDFLRRKLTDLDRLSLQNEIDILKQVDHPNIVKMYDIFEDDKYIYIVMEMLAGGEVSNTKLSFSFLTNCSRRKSSLNQRPETSSLLSSML